VLTVDSREIVITTGAEGRARLPLAVPLAAGSHEVSARFAEDALYLGAAAATTTFTVNASRGKVTGGVTVAAGKATFEANADGKVLKGELRWGSFNGDVTVLGVAADGRAAWFGGGAADGRTFVAYVEDNGEPGRNDVFRLWIAGTLVTPDGTVMAGNLQIHRPTKQTVTERASFNAIYEEHEGKVLPGPEGIESEMSRLGVGSTPGYAQRQSRLRDS